MTKTASTTVVYKLTYDTRRLNADLNGEEVYLANPENLTFHINLRSGRKQMTTSLDHWLVVPESVPIPEPVEFKGPFVTLLDTDWPESRADYPLFRHCLIDALRSAGEFPHRVITARITDDILSVGGEPDYVTGRTTDDYALLHLTRHLDVLDLARSTYWEYWPEVDGISGLIEPVLVPPPGGFPPVFRLTKNPEPLLISEAGRQALLDAHIQGISFEPFWEG